MPSKLMWATVIKETGEIFQLYRTRKSARDAAKRWNRGFPAGTTHRPVRVRVTWCGKELPQ